MAWISPVLTVKSNPFKISFSSIETCKFLIVKVDKIIPHLFLVKSTTVKLYIN